MGNTPEAGEDLAIALRDLNLHLQRTEIGDDQLRAAADAVRSVTAQLEGSPRLRWYENDTPASNTPVGSMGTSRVSAYREHTLFHGSQSPLAVPFKVEEEHRLDGTVGLVGRITVNRLYEGPPMTVHGGYLAGLFDAILGDTQRLAPGDPAMTGVLEIRYPQRTPLDTPLVFRSWIESDRGRRLLINASCKVEGGDGTVTAEAKGFFVRVPADRLRDGMRKGV